MYKFPDYNMIYVVGMGTPHLGTSALSGCPVSVDIFVQTLSIATDGECRYIFLVDRSRRAATGRYFVLPGRQ